MERLPSEWIAQRAREIKRTMALSDLDDFTIASGITIQAILDYLDKPTPKELCL